MQSPEEAEAGRGHKYSYTGMRVAFYPVFDVSKRDNGICDYKTLSGG
jgi:hypothetical protein